MIQIKPITSVYPPCDCQGVYIFSELLWQGLHVCEKITCNRCGKVIINSLPVNQSGIEQYTFLPGIDVIYDADGNSVPDNWYSLILKSIKKPLPDIVEMNIEVFEKHDNILILNTLDCIYGHSLLYLLNLQRIISATTISGIIVIVQPMLRWLVPEKGIAEIWTVNLEFRKLNNYYQDLSDRINSELNRFKSVSLSKGHVLPTNENINIENFTGIRPFDFSDSIAKQRITFIWRQDPDRIWIRNFYLLKGFKKLGMSRLLVPIQYFRVILFAKFLNRRLKGKYTFSVAGLGRFGKFNRIIEDHRVKSFNEESEKKLCRIYAESALVIGIHGSSMLLPSAHAGMTISLMPSKRWGNFAEDILFTENDVRIAAFNRRIIPLNICMSEILDIAEDMITGRDYFLKKFIHNDEL